MSYLLNTVTEKETLFHKVSWSLGASRLYLLVLFSGENRVLVSSCSVICLPGRFFFCLVGWVGLFLAFFIIYKLLNV